MTKLTNQKKAKNVLCLNGHTDFYVMVINLFRFLEGIYTLKE